MLRDAPVLVHSGVQEILVDGSQLVGKSLVEVLDDGSLRCYDKYKNEWTTDFWKWTPQTITSVAGITALTAAGRILTESHFLSDTLAGAALGIGALGATALVSSRSNG